MTVPTPEPDPIQKTARDDQDDVVEPDLADDLPDDGQRKRAEEIDELTQDAIDSSRLHDLPPGSAL